MLVQEPIFEANLPPARGREPRPLLGVAPRAVGVPQGRRDIGQNCDFIPGPVAGLVGIDGGVVSGVTNLESPGV
jgi:hypothetical protein